MAVNNIQFTKIEIEIIKFIFKHYKERFNPRQLAKILSINHANANNLCNILAQKKLLAREEIGNAVYYTFNYENKLAIKFIEYILSIEEFPKWLTVLLHSLDKFKPYIETGLVFGSSVKTKEYNDIDVFLLYTLDKSKEIKKIKDEIRKSQLVEKPIRYVDITPDDIIKNKEDMIFYNIISECLVFHNPEKYVEVLRNLKKISGTIKKQVF